MNKKEAQSQNKNKHSFVRQQVLHYSGILPPAEQFQKYENTYPGAAKEILSYATKQIEHRIESEKKITDANIKIQTMGMILAFLVVLSFLSVGCLLILKDKELSGLVALVAAFVPIVTFFFFRKKEKKIKN